MCIRDRFSDFDKKAYAFDLLEEEDKPKQQGSSTYIDRKFERVEDAMEGKLEGVIIHRGKNRYKLNPRYKYFVVLKSPMKELIQPL